MTDEYSRALARVAVGQLAELAGFEAVQASAADILSELMIKQVLVLLRASVVAGHVQRDHSVTGSTHCHVMTFKV
jgi:hypothetical protein